MTVKEADRLSVMKQIKRKEITLRKASIELGICYRQIKRIWKRYKKNGAKGLISQNRDRSSNNLLSEEVKTKALLLLRRQYYDYGPTLAQEKLETKHHIKLSKETTRQLMIKDGLWRAKKVKEKKIYARRTRRSRQGELIQIDGSYHHWLEDRGEKSCLLVCVDDATSAIMYLKFCKAETTQDYLECLQSYLDRYGRPMAFYSDKHSVFRVNNKKRYEGTFRTRFETVLRELDIKLICAHSPQAKGRVERANGTLQDRLIKELREQKINTIDEANEYLETFRLFYNEKFAVEPADKEDAHRKVLLIHKRDRLWMKKEERTLSKDLSFQYKKEIYQIDPKSRNRLQGKRVEIYEEKGEIKMILHGEKKLKYKKWQEKIEMPTRVVDSKELETLWPTIKRKPRRHHPWR